VMSGISMNLLIFTIALREQQRKGIIGGVR